MVSWLGTKIRVRSFEIRSFWSVGLKKKSPVTPEHRFESQVESPYSQVPYVRFVSQSKLPRSISPLNDWLYIPTSLEMAEFVGWSWSFMVVTIVLLAFNMNLERIAI